MNEKESAVINVRHIRMIRIAIKMLAKVYRWQTKIEWKCTRESGRGALSPMLQLLTTNRQVFQY